MNERLHHAFLVLLLLGHLALLSQQQAGHGSRFESLAMAVLGPVVGSVGSAVDGTGRFFRDLRFAGTLRRDNVALRQELDELRREIVRLQGMEEELERLSGLTGYRRAGSGDHFVADVVYVDPRSWLRTLVLYTGPERAEHNQPVVTDRGLVGRIIAASGSYAKVLLITDRSAAASAMIQRTRRKGVVHGDDDRLRLENIPALADVRVGDRVVTAGLDGVFPRGLAVGTVVSVGATEGQGDLFRRIDVQPAIDLSLLDQVFVLTNPPLPESVKADLLDDEDDGAGGL